MVVRGRATRAVGAGTIKDVSGAGKHDCQNAPGLARQVLGWIVIGLGLALMPLPGPGLLVLVLGIMLIGPRHPTIRRWAVLIRLTLRRLSQAEHHLLRRCGIVLRTRHAQARAFVREQLQRQANGQPLAPAVLLWIAFTILTVLVSAGMGILMLLS